MPEDWVVCNLKKKFEEFILDQIYCSQNKMRSKTQLLKIQLYKNECHIPLYILYLIISFFINFRILHKLDQSNYLDLYIYIFNLIIFKMS